MDYLEAAKVLKIPLGTVKSRVARARLQLKEKLEGSLRFPDFCGDHRWYLDYYQDSVRAV
jgi:hypothetical protein